MQTRKYIPASILLVVLLSVPPLHAQRAASAAATHHSLWKIQGKKNNVYLLGSVHLLKSEDYPLAAPIEAAFTNSNIAVFETDIEAIEKPELALQLAAKGQLPAGETLRDYLSPTIYTQFSNRLEKAGLPIQLFDRFTPAMAAISLVALEVQKMGLDPAKGLDKHFFDLARRDGKKLVPLETVDFQIHLMTDFTREEGELLMKTTLKEIDTMEKDFDELLRSWKTGDAAKLNKLLNEAREEAPAIFKRLVTDRNQRWLPKIEELSRGTDNAIVIVGAGHLVGSSGVVELLKKKGYKILQE